MCMNGHVVQPGTTLQDNPRQVDHASHYHVKQKSEIGWTKVLKCPAISLRVRGEMHGTEIEDVNSFPVSIPRQMWKFEVLVSTL